MDYLLDLYFNNILNKKIIFGAIKMSIENFEKMMKEQPTLVIATSVHDIPNVRIVNFIYVKEDKKIYFTSFKDNKKIEEFEKNPNIAFTTIPTIDTEHVRGKGLVSKSKLSIEDLSEFFISKIDGYKETIEFGGDDLLLFEITFKEVTVTLDYSNIETITI